MKKISILVICIVISILFTSCSIEDINENDTQKSVDAAIEEKHESSSEESIVDDSEHTVVYDESEVSFDSALYYDTEGIVEFIDENATPNMNFDVLGTEYSLTYENSTQLPDSELCMQVYKIEGTEYGRICFDSKSGRVLKYLGIPYTEELSASLCTEEDYLAFINKLIPTVDLSEYNDLKISTQYIEKFDGGFGSATKKGFYICQEDERFSSYLFYYLKTVDGILVEDRIVATFMGDAFCIEIYDLKHSREEYEPLLSNMEALNKHVEEYAGEIFKEKYAAFKIDSINHRLFIKDGTPCARSTVNVFFTYSEDEEPEWVTSFKVISSLIE